MINTKKIVENIQPTKFTDGSLEYTVQAFNADGKGIFERCAYNSNGDMNKLKKDLSLTIKCAIYKGVEVVKVNGVNVNEYIV